MLGMKAGKGFLEEKGDGAVKKHLQASTVAGYQNCGVYQFATRGIGRGKGMGWASTAFHPQYTHPPRSVRLSSLHAEGVWGHLVGRCFRMDMSMESGFTTK